MAHFAHIENGIVQQVIVVSDNDAPNPAPDHSEPLGQAFIRDVVGLSGEWKQTSYNGTFRKHYAGIGYTYDETLDAFVPPRPYPSWVLDEDTCLWEAPISHPENGKRYVWNEETQSWELVSPKEEA
jgi:hypothetical protein